MLRVSRLVDYATMLMKRLAEQPEVVASAAQLAEATRLELPTVSKLLKQLAHKGLVDSFRGAHGGYRLARPGNEVSVADIVEAVEGPIGMTDCAGEEGCCEREPDCAVRDNWQDINAEVRSVLSSVSVADLLRTVPRKRPQAG